MARLDYAHARAEMSGIPLGVGGPPPPGMDTKRGRLVCIKVRMLDDSVAVFHLGHKALGQTLLDEVARHLNLLENDYFGLECIDNSGCHCWLDADKPILRQITSHSTDAKFYFIVKFYTPNPIDLEEEYTRYLLTLQIRRDLSMGELHCAETTAALLAAYLVQSECGDFSAEDYPDATYLSHSRFIPHQTIEFQQKVMENHKNLIGMSPGESDFAMLEVARRCDFYGIKLHPAKDIEGTEARLAVLHLGIKVYHQLQCVSTFSWAKIRKLSFKRKKLLVKLHPDSYQYYKETIQFIFDSRNECKSFWKKCVEHHAFFRCSAADNTRKDNRLFSKGSSFRYHGRTQKQLIDYVREHHKRREPFTRPLRSAASPRCGPPFAVYSMVSDRKKNGGAHVSLPHLPNQTHTIDNADLGRSSFSKKTIYGVNSTFSSDSAIKSDIYQLPRKAETSVSLNSTTSQRLFERCDSSDSGSESMGGTVYSKDSMVILDTLMTSPKMTASSSIADSKLDYETWPDLSVVYTDVEDTVNGNKENVLSDMCYQIREDLLDHERSAARDFRLVCENLPRLIEPFLESSGVVMELSKKLKDLKESQASFLEEISSAENISQLAQRVLCMTHNVLPAYTTLLEQYPIYIAALDQLTKTNAEFRTEIRNFEESSQCYIPLNWILLKILHRIVAWRPILARLVGWQLSEGITDADFGPIRVALEKIARFADSTRKQREAITEFVALLQLELDTATQGLLTQPNRRLLRFGWVQRWSQRGLTPRMLLLFSDEVLLAHRSQETPFAINLELKLKGLLVEDGDSYNVTGKRDDAFTLHLGKKSIVLASPSKDQWIEDISSAVKHDVKNRLELPPILSENEQRISMSGCDVAVDEAQSKERRKLSPLQVCWYRKTSLNIQQIYDIVDVCQSGYLLRKLRNSNGWQRLWTELTSHTLFFYKTHKDISPLANLPLLEYKLCMPSVVDRVHHSNCFKLVYSTHEYFFRTNGSYSFHRWTEALRKAAISQVVPDVVTALSLRI
ncbi:hypothetical protein V3C99_017253 [Haemonchus contortus]